MSIATIITDSVRLTTPFEPPCRLDSLLHACRAPLAMPCGGRGVCGKCRVQAEGSLSQPDAIEAKTLGPALREGIRLACRALALGDVTLRPEKSGGDRIETEGEGVAIALDPWAEGLAVAIDVGTTTVAAYCYEPGSGRRVACAAAPNPQAAFGADVISRMEKAENGQADALREAILACLRALIAQMCAPEDVGCAVVTGNTAMLTLLAGVSPTPLLRAPFRMEQPFGVYADAAFPQLALHLPNAHVFLPRCPSAYVGADITCAMLAAGLFRDGQARRGAPVLLCDIGTNGEIVLCAGGALTACSTAAGPAFEGAGIRMGMTARDGAISHAWLEDGRLCFEVLGGGEAKGICGSGLVDALSALLEMGAVDETGRMDEETERLADCLCELDGQPAFRFPGTEVLLTQADVRAVQLAKSAVCAGMLTLLQDAGIAPEEVEALLIAGGFGTRINVRSAEKIGLIPHGFANRAHAIGNAAGMGASMMALSRRALCDGEAAALSCRTVELAANPVFMELYVENMMFEDESSNEN